MIIRKIVSNTLLFSYLTVASIHTIQNSKHTTNNHSRHINYCVKHSVMVPKLSHNFSTSKKSFKKKVTDLKNNILIVENKNSQQIPFMNEVKFQINGHVHYGVVLKIQQFITCIGLYDNLHEVPSQIEFNIIGQAKNINRSVLNQGALSVSDLIFTQQQTSIKPTKLKDIQYYGKQKLQSSNFFMQICYDMCYGDMLIFKGSKGSGKTRAIKDILQKHLQKQNHEAIYINLSKKDNKIMSMKNCTIINGNSQTTNTSAYILLLKAMQLCKANKHIILVIDGFNDFIKNQNGLMNSLKVSLLPNSIINQIYSQCSYYRQKSLTTIITTNHQQQQSLNIHSHTIKHLETMSSIIQFPLQLKSNFNKISKKQNQIQKMREYINKLLTMKNDFAMMKKLKVMQQQPWEQYYALDAQWWLEGLKKYHPTSQADMKQFLQFIIYNIQQQLCPQWSKSLIQIYKELTTFLNTTQKQMDLESLNQFLFNAKLNQLLLPYKKDYLH